MSSSSPPSLSADVDDYSTHVREFRHLLLSKQNIGDKHGSARQHLRRIFIEIDGNGDGTVSDSELYDFMISLDVPPHVAEILVQQIDINHDNKVTYSELAEFLWPRVESKREIGLVIEVVRGALISSIGNKIISRALKNNTDKDDETLLQAFAEKTKAVLVRGHLIDVRQLKRALHNLMSTALGELSDYEVEMLAHSMDANNDSVVSAREFKSWLFLQRGYFRAGSTASDASIAVGGTGSESFTYDDVYPDPDETAESEQKLLEERKALEAAKAETDRLAGEQKLKEAHIEAEKAEKKRIEFELAAVERKRAKEERLAAEQKIAVVNRLAAERKMKADMDRAAVEKAAETQRQGLHKKEQNARLLAEKASQDARVAAEKKSALESRICADRGVDGSLRRREFDKDVEKDDNEMAPLLPSNSGQISSAGDSLASFREPCIFFAGAAVCVVVTYSVLHALSREFR